MAGQAAGPGGLDHAALLYRGPEEFAAGVLGFVRSGVRAGEPVLVAGHGPGLQILRAELDGAGELVHWADAAGYGTGQGGVAALMRSFALCHAGHPVRCVHEAAWPGRPPREVAETFRQETLINRAFIQLPAAIMCAYDVRAGPAALASAERAHSSLIRAGLARPSPAYDEADQDNGPLGSPPAAAMVLSYRQAQAQVRQAAAAYARAAGLGEDRVQDVVLAVGELTGNTLKHTSGPGTLSMWTAHGELLAQIDDSGHIRGPLPGARHPAPGLAGNQGLWLVHQLSDLVDIRTSPAGTSVRIHVRLPS